MSYLIISLWLQRKDNPIPSYTEITVTQLHRLVWCYIWLCHVSCIDKEEVIAQPLILKKGV